MVYKTGVYANVKKWDADQIEQQIWQRHFIVCLGWHDNVITMTMTLLND